MKKAQFSTLMVDPDTLASFMEASGLSFKKNSVSYILTCSRCNKDKLYIRRRDGKFICWVCGADGFRGRAEYALAELCSLPLHEVRERLYGATPPPADGLLDLDPFDLNQFTDETVDESDLPLPTVQWPFNYYPIADWRCTKGREYLLKRGISLEVAQEYGLRYCPEERRVVIPVEKDGQLVGWQKRLVVPNRVYLEDEGRWAEVPKVLSSKDLPRDRVLMFGDRLKHSEHAILCEGPFDALMCHLAGANVATMGKIVSHAQLHQLVKAGVKRVYLALDPDAANETSKALAALKDVECYLLQPPAPYKDLGEMSMEAVKDLFLAAPRLMPWQLLIHLAV